MRFFVLWYAIYLPLSQIGFNVPQWKTPGGCVAISSPFLLITRYHVLFNMSSLIISSVDWSVVYPVDLFSWSWIIEYWLQGPMIIVKIHINHKLYQMCNMYAVWFELQLQAVLRKNI